MKILITGHLGQLATDLKSVLPTTPSSSRSLKTCPSGRARVLDFVQSHPDLILQLRCLNRVDDAEDSPEPAFAANTFALAISPSPRACDATLVHFSTTTSSTAPSPHRALH